MMNIVNTARRKDKMFVCGCIRILSLQESIDKNMKKENTPTYQVGVLLRQLLCSGKLKLDTKMWDVVQ